MGASLVANGIAFLVGLALGGVAYRLWSRSRVQALSGQLAYERERHQQEIDGLGAAHEQRVADLRMTEEKLRTEFTAVASTVLEKQAKAYEASAEKDLNRIAGETLGTLETKKQAIGLVVKELRDQLKDAGEKMSKFESERSSTYARIEHQIQGMLQQEQRLIEETQHLKSALTTSGAVRGRWGERVLSNILALSDLIEGQDYELQKVTANEQGDPLRPDCILRFPHGKRLAIDAKASLYEAYLAADASKTEEQRVALQLEFAKRLRSRARDLTRKEYQQHIGNSLPYVILFVPSEAAMRAALQSDLTILQDCAAQKVMIASPSTLMPLILTIADAWRQYRTAEHAAALTQEVQELGKRLVRFVERLLGVQKNLEAASKSWNLAIQQSWSGQKSVARSLDRIRDRGNALADVPDLPEVEILPVPVPEATGGLPAEAADLLPGGEIPQLAS